MVELKRNITLDEAKKKINGDRANDYGDAYVNHLRIAAHWSVIFGRPVSVEEVYQCLIAMKLSRVAHTPHHQDTWEDICGYAALASELSIDDN